MQLFWEIFKIYSDFPNTYFHFQHEHSRKPPTRKVKQVEVQKHLKGKVRNQLVDHWKKKKKISENLRYFYINEICREKHVE